MTKIRRATRFFCHECNVGFELIDPTSIGRNERKHCPKCGDYFSVKVMKKPGQYWSDYELEKLEEYVKGKIKLYNLVNMTGRTRQSIYRKKFRMYGEGVAETYTFWKPDEKALAETCLHGEMTIKELSEKTGRTYDSVQSYVKRLKEKQKQGVTL